MTVYFRDCPRCGGDVKRNRDHYGEYHQCLQCGYMLDIDKTPDKRSHRLSEHAKTVHKGQRRVA